MNSTPNKLPSAFQTLTNPVKCTISAQNPHASTNSFFGYKSKFNISEQKKAYEQQRELSQQPTNFQQYRQFQTIQPTEISFESLWCDLCERSFKNPQQLKRHIDEHEKCCFEGCIFEGHSGLLKKHIEMQHNSGFFSRIIKIESDEDIEKWRAERKKRYPTMANVEARRLAQEQRMKRGERLDKEKNRFGKTSDRHRAREFISQDKNNRNRNHNKTRRPRNRKNKNPAENEVKDNEIYEKNEVNSTKISEETSKPQNKDQINPLSSLIGAYITSTDDEEEEGNGVQKPIEDNNGEVEASASFEMMKEIVNVENTLEKVEDGIEDEQPPDEQPIERKKEKIKCITNSNYDGRKRPSDRSNDQMKRAKIAKRATLLDMTKKIRNQNSLLEKLLQNDIRHERNVLLQCVRYVVENNFFSIGQKK